MKDGFRAIYCILRYNLSHLPLGMKVFLTGVVCSALAAGAGILYVYKLLVG